LCRPRRHGHGQHFTQHLHLLVLTGLVLVHALGKFLKLLFGFLSDFLSMMLVALDFIILYLDFNEFCLGFLKFSGEIIDLLKGLSKFKLHLAESIVELLLALAEAA